MCFKEWLSAQTCCVELYTDTQLLWLVLIHQCFHVGCWKCFGIHVGDFYFYFFEKLRNDPSFTEDLSLHCLHSIWILKREWVPASSWRPVRMGILVRARGSTTPRPWGWGGGGGPPHRNVRVPQAFATLQYGDRADKIMNDQFRCAMHCQRHTPHSHKAISWQVLVV